MIKIVKRTFEAKKYPKNSLKRKELNKNTITSEYMPSYKYAIIGKHFAFTKQTKKEAVAFYKKIKERMRIN